MVDASARSASVQQVERVPVFRSVLLTDVEPRTDFLHLFLGTQRPQAFQVGVVQRQTRRDDLEQQTYRSERAAAVDGGKCGSQGSCRFWLRSPSAT